MRSEGECVEHCSANDNIRADAQHRLVQSRATMVLPPPSTESVVGGSASSQSLVPAAAESVVGGNSDTD